MLDNTVAAPIVVGNEGNLSAYFPGVPLGGLPACQADDEYTFTSDGKFTYDAKGETFVALDAAGKTRTPARLRVPITARSPSGRPRARASRSLCWAKPACSLA
ncbi:MAG: hypothetical protein WKG07_32015 [Hymenobacter sp.]